MIVNSLKSPNFQSLLNCFFHFWFDLNMLNCHNDSLSLKCLLFFSFVCCKILICRFKFKLKYDRLIFIQYYRELGRLQGRLEYMHHRDRPHVQQNLVNKIFLCVFFLFRRFENTGTHLLTEIIDASWKFNAYYNGVCMRRGECYVCVIYFLCLWTVSITCFVFLS